MKIINSYIIEHMLEPDVTNLTVNMCSSLFSESKYVKKIYCIIVLTLKDNATLAENLLSVGYIFSTEKASHSDGARQCRDTDLLTVTCTSNTCK